MLSYQKLRKPMDGRYTKLLQSDEVNRRSSLMMAVEKQLYSGTEGFVMAIQDRETMRHIAYS